MRQRLCKVSRWVGPSACLQRSTACGNQSSPSRSSPSSLKLAPTNAASSAATSGWWPRSDSMRRVAALSRSAAVTTPPCPRRGTACVKIDAMRFLTCSARASAARAVSACRSARSRCHSATVAPAPSATTTSTRAYAPPSSAASTASTTANSNLCRRAHRRRGSPARPAERAPVRRADGAPDHRPARRSSRSAPRSPSPPRTPGSRRGRPRVGVARPHR